MPSAMSYETNPAALAALLGAAELFISSVGDDLLKRMQVTVPKKTWSLHDSLVKETGRGDTFGTVFVDVGVDDTFTSKVGRHPADYVTFVERGTSRQVAQPFELPSLLQTIGNLQGVKGVRIV